MDITTQVVLVIMVLVLGSTLTVVGIMVVFVLRDLRESISRVNLVLDDFHEVTAKLSVGSNRIEEALVSLRDSLDLFKSQAASPLGSVVGLFGLFKGLLGRGGKNE